MLLAHKIEIRPDMFQKEYIDRACGCRRHCYNQLLAHFCQKDVKWNKKEAHKLYIQLRAEFPWYADVSGRATKNAIQDLDSAYQHFFRRVKEGIKPYGYPTFKEKDKREVFSLREPNRFKIEGRTITIERLRGKPIKMRQRLRFTGNIKQVTFSKRAGKYFVSILVDTFDYNPKDVNRFPSVGVDFGIKEMAFLSDGNSYPANQQLKRSLKKLKRLQRQLAKKQKGSNRRASLKLKLQKHHYYITCRRQAILHEISDDITSKFNLVTIENLNVKGMKKNRKLSRCISDAGFGMLRQFIVYKSKLRNGTVVLVDTFFPSSKTCCSCGRKKDDLTLQDRVYECNHCGLVFDRDYNAAINLDNYGRKEVGMKIRKIEAMNYPEYWDSLEAA